MSLDINTHPLTMAERLSNLERQNEELAAAYAEAIASGNAAAVGEYFVLLDPLGADSAVLDIIGKIK